MWVKEDEADAVAGVDLWLAGVRATPQELEQLLCDRRRMVEIGWIHHCLVPATNRDNDVSRLSTAEEICFYQRQCRSSWQLAGR